MSDETMRFRGRPLPIPAFVQTPIPDPRERGEVIDHTKAERLAREAVRMNDAPDGELATLARAYLALRKTHQRCGDALGDCMRESRAIRASTRGGTVTEAMVRDALLASERDLREGETYAGLIAAHLTAALTPDAERAP